LEPPLVESVETDYKAQDLQKVPPFSQDEQACFHL
jgi:hypothetical protein